MVARRVAVSTLDAIRAVVQSSPQAAYEKVCGGALNLKRTGRVWQGLCPLHNDKRTPSFTVYEDGGWYCFGACQAGGDFLSFVKAQRGVGFAQAVEIAAGLLGVQIEYDGVDSAQFTRVKRALREATRIFHERSLLQGKSTGAQNARRYLASRAVTGETVSRFQIGYAPAGDQLLKALSKMFPGNVLQEAGLVTRGGKPFFRDMLTFPITTSSGGVIGFGGRSLRGGGGKKYINSPNTMVFNKQSAVFGLAQYRRQSDTVILVEGYMDVLRLQQCGVANVLAVMGTSATKATLPPAAKVVLCMDGDSAGHKAAWRLTASLAPFRQVHVVELPDGHDPDSYVGKFGVDDFLSLVARAEDALLYFARLLTNLSPHGRAQRLRKVFFPLLGKMDPVVCYGYLDEIANMIGVDQSAMRDSYYDFLDDSARAAVARKAHTRGKDDRRPQKEHRLLALLLTYTSLTDKLNVQESVFRDESARDLFIAWRKGEADGHPLLDKLVDILEENLPDSEENAMREAKALLGWLMQRNMLSVAQAMLATIM